MTTSEPRRCVALQAAGAGLDALAEAARGGGDPSTALLSRLANELFRQPPGAGHTPGFAPAPQPSALSAAPAAAGVDPLDALVAPLQAHGAPASLPSSAPFPGTPDVPGGPALGGSPLPNAPGLPGLAALPAAPAAAPAPILAGVPRATSTPPYSGFPAAPATGLPTHPGIDSFAVAGIPGLPALGLTTAPGGADRFAQPTAFGLPAHAGAPAGGVPALAVVPQVPGLPGHPGAPRSPTPAFGLPAHPGVPSSGLPASTEVPRVSGLPNHPGANHTAATPLAAARTDAPGSGFDVHAIRRDFPILQERVHGRPLIWFDNAATTQKPQAVIDRIAHFYQHENSNIHRAAHTLAARATDAYEGARETVRRFIGAASTEEIIFVRGATEGINLVAQTWGLDNLEAGDEIVLTHLEHHANIVPWQQVVEQTGAVIRVAPVDDRGQVVLDAYERLLGPRTKLVAFTQVSNALGTVTPAQVMAALAHRVGAVVLIDGAQSISHMRVDVQALGADFFIFSGHKVFAPTGIGAVYGHRDLLQGLRPYQRGGNMIADVTFERSVFQDPPGRFEAGTGNIADAVGLGAALEYVERIGIERIAAYEHDLLVYGTHQLSQVPGLRLVGTAHEKASVLSFTLNGFTTQDVGKALDEAGIAVRSGHHCAQPILRRFGLESTVRPSLAFYNTHAEIDVLATTLRRLVGGRAPHR